MGTMKGSSALHTRLVKDCLLALGGTGRCVVWRNEVGLALNIRTEEPFSYGLPGSPDIIGFADGGRFVGFECKTGKAIQSDIQKAFEAACVKKGASYFVVRSADEAVAFLNTVYLTKGAP